MNQQSADYNLVLEGSLTIEKTSEIKEKIIDLFSQHNSLSVDLENITDIDIAGVQLICSSKRYFEKHSKMFLKKDINNELVKNFIDELGYNPDGVCYETSCKGCIWEGDK